MLWASGLAASAVLAALFGSGAAASRALLGVCGGLWGLRLGLRLWRRVRAEPEDGRYRSLRERWGEGQANWFGVFQFQAWLIALFSVPFVIAATNPAPQPASLAVAAAIWIASMVGGNIANQQLARGLPRLSGAHLHAVPLAAQDTLIHPVRRG